MIRRTDLFPRKFMTRSKNRMVFVGSFVKVADGTLGGQAFACETLLESEISNHVQWVKLDSTQRSQPPPGLLTRAWYAAIRILTCFKHVILSRIDGALVFSPFTPSSLLEKLMMCAIFRLFRKHVVFSIRSEISSSAANSSLRLLTKILVSLPNVIICQSAEALNNLEKLALRHIETARVVPNWIPCAQYEVTSKVSERPTTFLFLGWIETQKGIYDIADASRRLRDKGVRFRVICCGGGSELRQFQETVAQLGLTDILHIRPWVTGVAKKNALAEADVFLLPSYTEGLPNALLEAMASGLAIISTRVGGIPSIVEDQVNGILVNVGSPEEVANAMSRFIEQRDLWRNMGAANRMKIEQKHNLDLLWREIGAALNVDLPEKAVRKGSYA